MGVLEGLKPERVFYYFEEICKIPHGSYNVAAISDYCVSVAQSLNLEVRQDEEYNVVIRKPASEGYGEAPVLMLQGHLDMVCVKDAGVDFDFEKDGLNLVVEDGYVHAKGTTLGGDDGIAVAMGLAILEDNTIEHPELEVVFTTEEEVGMEGAIALDTADLKAKYLLNLDSEDEGHFLAGCAGGVKATSVFPMSCASAEGTAMTLHVHGLVGGHSGAEIDKGRANANILLGRLLFELHEALPFCIISVDGGDKDNAIPVDSKAEIVVSDEDIDEIQSLAAAFQEKVRSEFHVCDPVIAIDAVVRAEGGYEVFSMALTEKVIFMLMQVPNGIQTMSADLPGLVESSLNLGVLATTEEGVAMTWAIRSSVKSLKELMKDKLRYMTEFLGGEMTFRGEYPEWPFNPDSKICALCKKIYEEQTGEEASIEMIHAGLECGLLSEKMPWLDMVSMGPEMHDIHTSRERLGIASVERTYNLVLTVLKEFKNYCN